MKTIRLKEAIQIPGGAEGQEWGLLSGETLSAEPCQYRLNDEDAGRLQETYGDVVVIVSGSRVSRLFRNGNTIETEITKFTKEGKRGDETTAPNAVTPS